MTIAEALREATQRLSATSDTARLDAELLMAHALRCSRSDLLLRHTQDEVPDDFDQLVDRRAKREPVAYILGRQEFFGLDFIVGQGALIPRGDSECVVQAALDAAPGAMRVLDMGTGSGALLLTLLDRLAGAQGVGIDSSPAAIAIARKNADLHGQCARAAFLELDWARPGWADDLGRFDIVICNPPYVEADADLAPDVRDYEPASALFAGAEGLDDYRVIIPQLPQLLTETGVAILEIGASQASAVSEIAREHGFTATAHQDLAGRDRALELRLRLGKDDSSS